MLGESDAHRCITKGQPFAPKAAQVQIVRMSRCPKGTKGMGMAATFVYRTSDVDF